MQTNIHIGSPLAVKRWSTALATETKKLMYFTRFIGEGAELSDGLLKSFAQ